MWVSAKRDKGKARTAVLIHKGSHSTNRRRLLIHKGGLFIPLAVNWRGEEWKLSPRASETLREREAANFVVKGESNKGQHAKWECVVKWECAKSCKMLTRRQHQQKTASHSSVNEDASWEKTCDGQRRVESDDRSGNPGKRDALPGDTHEDRPRLRAESPSLLRLESRKTVWETKSEISEEPGAQQGARQCC